MKINKRQASAETLCANYVASYFSNEGQIYLNAHFKNDFTFPFKYSNLTVIKYLQCDNRIYSKLQAVQACTD